MAALLAAGLALTLADGAHAQSTWNLTGGGGWGTAGNWSPSGVPGGVGAVVNFTNNITSDATISLGTTRTVGTINMGDADGTHRFDPGSYARPVPSLRIPKFPFICRYPENTPATDAHSGQFNRILNP
jgi:hypothetical protein